MRLDDLLFDAQDAEEVRYWSRKLGVTEEALGRASRAAGDRLAPVIELLLSEGYREGSRHPPVS